MIWDFETPGKIKWWSFSKTWTKRFFEIFIVSFQKKPLTFDLRECDFFFLSFFGVVIKHYWELAWAQILEPNFRSLNYPCCLLILMTSGRLLTLFMPQFIHPAQKGGGGGEVEEEENGNSICLLGNYRDQMSQSVGSERHLVSALTYYHQVVLYNE